jgi:hypothetical protein
LISILPAVSTDITNCTTNRSNAASSGAEVGYASGTTSKTGGTSNGTQGAWQIQFTHTVTFADANAARYFWNAGGRVRLQYGKTSTGTDLPLLVSRDHSISLVSLVPKLLQQLATLEPHVSADQVEHRPYCPQPLVGMH